MINTGLTNRTSIIPYGQKNADDVLKSALTFQSYTSDTNKWRVDIEADETPFGKTIKIARVYYSDIIVACLYDNNGRIVFYIDQCKVVQEITGKINQLLKRLNLKCGIKSTTKELYVKQLYVEDPHVFTVCSGYGTCIVTVDLKATKESTRKELWFMRYYK